MYGFGGFMAQSHYWCSPVLALHNCWPLTQTPSHRGANIPDHQYQCGAATRPPSAQGSANSQPLCERRPLCLSTICTPQHFPIWLNTDMGRAGHYLSAPILLWYSMNDPISWLDFSEWLFLTTESCFWGFLLQTGLIFRLPLFRCLILDFRCWPMNPSFNREKQLPQEHFYGSWPKRLATETGKKYYLVFHYFCLIAIWIY